MLTLEKFSLGVGDRFAHQARAQLEACRMAAARGAAVIPVWNKSNREHLIVGSEPGSVRDAADAAVCALGWTVPYHVDADHINLGTVDRFIDASDFYTIDVASAIGQPASGEDIAAFVDRHPGLARETGVHTMSSIAGKYLYAMQQAAEIYRHIKEQRAGRPFITEVSMDETDSPQTPPELLVILAAIADAGIPIQTIAPKFTGRFNKGVDYAGDVEQFEKEFSEDIEVIALAVAQYGLPESLKLSVHSGSDKFSIYPSIRHVLRRSGAGVHVKTAGTTWLEELIGLAEADGEGLELARQVYTKAYADREALCAPYASVIDIDETKLPDPAAVKGWTSEQYTGALRHDQTNPAFNPDVRQLLHVGYKVAAKMGEQYLTMLKACEEPISRNVTANLFERHIRPIFLEQ
jgi:tagaturonate epimerase